MLVKLIGNKKIIKMNLPETIEGNYWVCDNCNARAFEKIRYGKSVRVDFYRDDDIERRK